MENLIKIKSKPIEERIKSIFDILQGNDILDKQQSEFIRDNFIDECKAIKKANRDTPISGYTWDERSEKVIKLAVSIFKQ